MFVPHRNTLVEGLRREHVARSRQVNLTLLHHPSWGFAGGRLDPIPSRDSTHADTKNSVTKPGLKSQFVVENLSGQAVSMIACAVPHLPRADYTITVTTGDCDDPAVVASESAIQIRTIQATFVGQHRFPDIPNVQGDPWIRETDSAGNWALTNNPISTPEPRPTDGWNWGVPLHTIQDPSATSSTTTQDFQATISVSSSPSPSLSNDGEPLATDVSSLTITTTTSSAMVSKELPSTVPVLPTSQAPSNSTGAQDSSSSPSSSAIPLDTSGTLTSRTHIDSGSPPSPTSSSLSTVRSSEAINSASSRSTDMSTGSATNSGNGDRTTASIVDTSTDSITLSTLASSTTTSEIFSTQMSTSNASGTLNTTSSSGTIATTSDTSRRVGSTSASVAAPATTSAQSHSTTLLSFQSSTDSATSSASLNNISSLTSLLPTSTSASQSISASDIFQAVATEPPPEQIHTRSDHPVARLGIQQQTQRLQTNKFYANFFLGSQSAATWTHPYSVAWSKGAGETNSWGLAVMHIERDQLAGTGSKASWDAGDWGYVVNPTGLQSIALSAAELSNGTTLTTDSLEAFSVNVNLIAEGSNAPVLTFPLVQGMGFVTAMYDNGTPLVQSGLGIDTFAYVGTVAAGSTYKYEVRLLNGFTWLLYVTPQGSQFSTNSLELVSGTIRGPSGFSGYIQVAKIPGSNSTTESVYDNTAAVYPTAANVTGTVTGTSGSYTISWTKGGNTDRTLLMYALPHHIDSLSVSTKAATTDLQLVTTTKGYATAIRADSWTLVEADLPVDMGFSPWTPQQGNIGIVSSAAQTAIASSGNAELQQNVTAQTDTGSLYYDGKALAKFATICVTLFEVARDEAAALSGLATLKEAFEMHINNEMPNPLVYDDAWGGAVSSASYADGNFGDDFGNTVYNDHHFHFGYFVYAAAVIGHLDNDWLNEGTNKAWVNMLVRDYANSISSDAYYPFSRMFDWYHGHSWAHGLIETGDGKDQESSSEDTMSLYAIKMWGRVIGDTNMEARGNLMLSIQARSLQHYYLYLNNNDVEPAQFIGNKVAGILFENKIDHTTYFGNEAEYIEGIHMLPILPCSTLTRTTEFVQQEWDTYFSNSGIRPAGDVTGGWKGIILANYAIIDPQTSYDYFTSISQDELDGGASQTWYLAWAAALGGSPAANTTKREVEHRPSSMADLGPQVSQKVSQKVSQRVSPRHHGDAYKLRSDGVGMPGAEVDLPSDATSRKEAHHRMTRRNHGDAYGKHNLMTNTTDMSNATTTSTESWRTLGNKRSSRLRQRTRGVMWQV
nr:putative endo-1,3(4)-beta-glucanase [Quercus suber]